MGSSSAELYDALAESVEADSNDDTSLEDYTQDMIEALVPRHDSQDTDQGPYLAWRAFHGYLPRSAWVMLSTNSGLRERGYVLWDWDRMERYNMIELFQNIPNRASHAHTDEDYEEMEASFDQRSKIWQKGGSGYWRKGDTSKIVWPRVQPT